MLTFNRVNSIFLIVLLLLLVCYQYYAFSLWYVVLVPLIWFVVTGLGSALITWNYHIKALCKNDKVANNWVAITFDDGPNTECTPKVLELLDTYNAKATFFCIGKHIEQYPEIANNILDREHVIGNHTYSHSAMFGFFSTKKVVAELSKTNAVAQQLLHRELALYRPAFGVTNPNIKRALQQLPLTAIGWSKRSLDTTNLTEDKIFKRATHNLKAGDVILLHDTSAKSIAVLERLLLFLQEQNLQSVTVDKLFNIKPYA